MLLLLAGSFLCRLENGVYMVSQWNGSLAAPRRNGPATSYIGDEDPTTAKRVFVLEQHLLACCSTRVFPMPSKCP